MILILPLLSSFCACYDCLFFDLFVHGRVVLGMVFLTDDSGKRHTPFLIYGPK